MKPLRRSTTIRRLKKILAELPRNTRKWSPVANCKSDLGPGCILQQALRSTRFQECCDLARVTSLTPKETALITAHYDSHKRAALRKAIEALGKHP